MSNLIHLIYSSAATREITDDEIIILLTRARMKNARFGITGMLLFENGSFFQVLEGPAENVDVIYQEIAQDDRHTSIVTIIREPIFKRTFGDWTMGYSKFSSEELEEISQSVFGLNDFFTSGSSFSQLNQGRAKKLISVFQDGRWRVKI